jgi:hypothetical protein
MAFCALVPKKHMAFCALFPKKRSVSSRIIHPSLRGHMPRERGTYWWTEHQMKLEHEVLEHGTFYVFLEEECTYGNIIAMVRYGNVFMTDHWDMRIEMTPKTS